MKVIAMCKSVLGFVIEGENPTGHSKKEESRDCFFAGTLLLLIVSPCLSERLCRSLG